VKEVDTEAFSSPMVTTQMDSEDDEESLAGTTGRKRLPSIVLTEHGTALVLPCIRLSWISDWRSNRRGGMVEWCGLLFWRSSALMPPVHPSISCLSFICLGPAQVGRVRTSCCLTFPKSPIHSNRPLVSFIRKGAFCLTSRSSSISEPWTSPCVLLSNVVQLVPTLLLNDR